MITVHHLNHSRSQRVLWLLEEIGRPYEIVRYDRDVKSYRAPDALKRIHPLGKSPVIQDGAVTLAETGAIVEYLIATYAPAMVPPPGSQAHWRNVYWMHYAEGSLMPQLLMRLVIQRMGVLGWPARGVFVRQLKLHVDYVEAELAKGAWFTGAELRGGDIMMSFPLEAGISRAGLTPKSNPKIFDFVKRAQARPAYQRALAKGGDYAYATKG